MAGMWRELQECDHLDTKNNGGGRVVAGEDHSMRAFVPKWVTCWFESRQGCWVAGRAWKIKGE